jgi:serine/threonine protein phosphatase PrpC
MTQPITSGDGDGSPVLLATSAAGQDGEVPSARSIGRTFPLGEDGQRFLLGVAEGIGDRPSAEAQAAEALARLEQITARASLETQPAGVLDAAYAEAGEAIARLNALPGSVPGSGAALVAAIVADNRATVANLGRGAAYLRRGGALRRLTPDHRWSPVTRQPETSGTVDPDATLEFGGRTPLGSGDPATPDITAPIALQPGDTLLLCSESVARRLGSKVIDAVLDEFPPEAAARELCDLAGRQEGVTGAAATLLHLPATKVPVLPAAAAVVAAPLAPVPHRRRLGLTFAVFAGAIAVGAALAGTIYVAATRGDNSQAKSSPTALARQAAASPTATLPALLVRSPTPQAAAPRPGTPAATPGARTPGPPAASPTPILAANLPSCNGGRPPCRYQAQPGDSASAIGDRFDLTRACFEAANRAHQPIPPRAPDFRIGVAEEYVVLDAAGCATLLAANQTPTAGARASATSTTSLSAATVPPACTPRPGASAVNPSC